MKAMKWIIPGLFLVLGILGLCFFLDAQRVPPPAPPAIEKEEQNEEAQKDESERPDTSSPEPPLSLARQRLSEMTLEEKLGQVFLVRCPLAEERPEIEALTPGGVLLFGRDLKGRTPLRSRQTPKAGNKMPKYPSFSPWMKRGAPCAASVETQGFGRRNFSLPDRPITKAAGKQ